MLKNNANKYLTYLPTLPLIRAGPWAPPAPPPPHAPRRCQSSLQKTGIFISFNYISW